MIFNEAKNLDAQDDLAHYRSHFDLPENTIYFDGNSLGPLLVKTKEHMQDVIENQWKNQLIRGWNAQWYGLQEKLGNTLAKILGASSGEVILSDSTSINLFKLATAIIKQQPNKTVLIESTNFPTDMYLLQGIQELLDNKFDLKYIDTDDFTKAVERIGSALQKNDVGLLVLSHVAFKSGYKFDLKEINQLAEKYGAKVLWDLSHSAGAVDIDLYRTNTQFAVGCTYKYLNGGPGSPAFLYVNQQEMEALRSPIWGWFAHTNPFAFEQEFEPEKSIRKFLVGTPPILSLSAIQPSLELFEQADMQKVEAKSKALSEFFIKCVKKELIQHGFQIRSPINPTLRGSHVVISHDKAWQICQSLIDENVEGLAIIPDFRAPNFIRFGFAPLYNGFSEVALAVAQISKIMNKTLYDKYDAEIGGVT